MARCNEFRSNHALTHLAGHSSPSRFVHSMMTLNVSKDDSPVVAYQRTKSKPTSICWSHSTGMLIIPCSVTHQLIFMDLLGNVMSRVGEFGDEDGNFNSANCVAFDSVNNRIIVSDAMNQRIQILSSTGKFMSSFGHEGIFAGQLNHPHGVAVSPDGCIIAVADTHNHRVQLFTADGDYYRLFDYGRLLPSKVIFNFEGDSLYVSCLAENFIIKQSIFNKHCTTIRAHPDLDRPSGLGMNASGNILITDGIATSITILRPNGSRNLLDIISPVPSRPCAVAHIKSDLIAVINQDWTIDVQ